jgi:hypothetical protein
MRNMVSSWRFWADVTLLACANVAVPAVGSVRAVPSRCSCHPVGVVITPAAPPGASISSQRTKGFEKVEVTFGTPPHCEGLHFGTL